MGIYLSYFGAILPGNTKVPGKTAITADPTSASQAIESTEPAKLVTVAQVKQAANEFGAIYTKYQPNPSDTQKAELILVASKVINGIRRLYKQEKTSREAESIFLRQKARFNKLGCFYSPQPSVLSKLYFSLSNGDFDHIFTQAANTYFPTLHRLQSQNVTRLISENKTAGYEIDDIYANNETIGKVFLFSPQATKISFVKGRTEKDQGNILLYCSGPYFTDRDHPVGFSAINGAFVNKLVNDEMGGLVMISPAGLKISPISDPTTNLTSTEGLNQLTKRVKAGNLSVFQGHLLLHQGVEIISNNSKPSRESRRLLANFNDGRFGIIDIEEKVTLYEAAVFARKLGATEAVNLDTGGFNKGGYKTLDGFEKLGKPGDPPVFSLEFTQI
ncbi:MAG: phosphodiester glycosidase family protein [bacterium]